MCRMPVKRPGRTDVGLMELSDLTAVYCVTFIQEPYVRVIRRGNKVLKNELISTVQTKDWLICLSALTFFTENIREIRSSRFTCKSINIVRVLNQGGEKHKLNEMRRWNLYSAKI